MTRIAREGFSEKSMKIRTNICPTCGCSLVRLGIDPKQSKSLIIEGEKHYFCCEGCQEIFQENPKLFIDELNDIHVCPVCLAEKISAHTVFWLNTPDTLMRDNNRQSLECHHGTET